MLELVTTACNIATLGVLIAAAAAAIVQLRHMRAGYELQALLAIEKSFADRELQGALLYTQDELPGRLAEPRYRRELEARGYIDAREHPEMTVCNWFNDAGTMVAGGFIDDDVFFDSYARLVDYYWGLLAPAIALLRRQRGSDQYANFELLAERARRWLAAHAEGSYPATAPRMPLADAGLEPPAQSRGLEPA